jgi:hypothetical protein
VTGSTIDGRLYVYDGAVVTIINNTFTHTLYINSGATISIAWNDLSLGLVIATGNPTATIDFENNWWGTTEPTIIETKITHHEDDPSRPWVDFEPWLQFPLLEPAIEPPDPNVLQVTGIGTLRLVDSNHPVDTLKPTIVLTHGWNPDYPGKKTNPGEIPNWVNMMKESIFAQSWGQDWNVLWWDWIEKATAYSPAGPAKQTQWQGNYLGDALMETLGDGYTQYMHFIGKSLGTSVNRWAADMVHNNGWDPNNTHVTILDAAEIGDLTLLVEPVPEQAAFVDTYISAFGDLHDDARNVILTQGAPITPTDILDYIDFHDYPTVWYDETIDNPAFSYMGLVWSFVYDGFEGAPPEGSCFAQTPSTSDPEGELNSISWADARIRLGARTVVQVGQGVSIVYGMATAPLKYIGDVTIDAVEDFVTAKLKESLGTGQLLLATSQGLDIVSTTDNQVSSSYLWIPLTIPLGVDLMSFDCRFTNASDEDYLTVSIDSRQVFIMEAKFVIDGEYYTSSYIDISGLSGEDVEIIIAFNCDDVPGGELDVTDFAFHSTAVLSDLNTDGLINFEDFSRFAGNWGNVDCNEMNDWCNKCDFNRSNLVDANDLGLIIDSWLRDSGDPNTWREMCANSVHQLMSLSDASFLMN